MLIRQKSGHITSFETSDRTIDLLRLEWYESSKRILHKRTAAGRGITLKFLNENQNLSDGDVLYADAESIIVVDIVPCEAIVITPASMKEMASVCYEIGNKHLPVFYAEKTLLVPFEEPLFRLLLSAGYDAKKVVRKLINPLRSTVTPHPHSAGSGSLFSKILKLTISDDK